MLTSLKDRMGKITTLDKFQVHAKNSV